MGSMAKSWQQAVVYGQTTSVDTVRNQTYTVKSLAGVKRGYDQINGRNGEESKGTVSPVGQPAYRRRPKARLQNRLNASRVLDLPTTESRSRTKAPSAPPNNSVALSQDPLLSLRHSRYGLPTRLAENFESLGVRNIYSWQSSCHLGRGFLEGSKNLIYTVPTGGGKSLVADVLMLKRVIDQPGKKAILVLPFVALAQEKLKWLRSIVEGVTKNITEDEVHCGNTRFATLNNNIQVMGFLGGSRAKVTCPDMDIAVCTIEKANALVNTAIEEARPTNWAYLFWTRCTCSMMRVEAKLWNLWLRS